MIERKKLKKLPNVNKCQGITHILLFFHNSYFYLNGSEKKKNVPHSSGLPYRSRSSYLYHKLICKLSFHFRVVIYLFLLSYYLLLCQRAKLRKIRVKFTQIKKKLRNVLANYATFNQFTIFCKRFLLRSSNASVLNSSGLSNKHAANIFRSYCKTNSTNNSLLNPRVLWWICLTMFNRKSSLPWKFPIEYFK
jgi:hypothetical protein